MLKLMDNLFVLHLQQTPLYHFPYDPGILPCYVSRLVGGDDAKDFKTSQSSTSKLCNTTLQQTDDATLMTK
ncbi:hypothetical protein KP509_09G097800 [Ceratopteris richardii]|nr:hypothetical protein KP509_09G097800 [Ceratopteris richardii]